MIHTQERGTWNSAQGTYAHCPCGWCGPIRPTATAAREDERAHAALCSRKAAA